METSLVSIYMHLFNTSLLFQVGCIPFIHFSWLATQWIKISSKMPILAVSQKIPFTCATSSSLLGNFSPHAALLSGFWKASLLKLCLDFGESGLCSRNQIAPKISMVAEAKMFQSIHGEIGSKGRNILLWDLHWILPFGHQLYELSLNMNGIVIYHFQLFYI